MCGLAAIFCYGAAAAPVDGDELLRIRDHMTRRGPDGAGLWISDDSLVGFGHRRLSILDLSEGGAQPMFSDDGQVGIVFNGEIYNFRELRRELEEQGIRFRSHSDTEVLIALYRRHGRAMLDKLRGMFAFVIWDAKAQGVLLARDHFGIKPLYFADDGRTLRVASQVKALVAGGALETSPDPAGKVGFLLWGHVPEPFTWYRQIKALPAGSWLWLDRQGQRQEGRFFDLGQELAAAQPGPGDLRQMLLDSVRAHLISDVKVGLFLSAGLDSASLCGFAAELGGAGLATVTLGFDEFAGSEYDETPLAAQIAQHYGTRHHTARISRDDFINYRQDLMDSMDQPSIDGVNTWFVARATRTLGLKVALSGLGGDELLAGYDSFHQIPKLTSWLAPIRLAPGLGRGFRWLSSALIGHRLSPKWAGILELGTNVGDAYLLRRGLFMPWELPEIADPDLVRQGWQDLAARNTLRQKIKGITPPRQQVQMLETSCYMRNQLLRDSDWAGMAHSVEIRTPLVDIGLFRAILPLIAAKRPPVKQDMAACLTPTLPDAVLHRRKTGFFIPVAQWLGERNLRTWARKLAAA